MLSCCRQEPTNLVGTISLRVPEESPGIAGLELAAGILGEVRRSQLPQVGEDREGRVLVGDASGGRRNT